MIAILLSNQLAYAGDSLFSIPSAYAKTTPSAPVTEPSDTHKKQGLIAILVDNTLLNDKKSYSTEKSSATLTEHIFAFAQNVQNRVPHSLAFVIGIDPNESPVKIGNILEKLYYEGYDSDLLDSNNFNNDSIPEDDNQLIGAVFIGDLPMPVVYEDDNSAHPSLYPYTDFYRKRYLYDQATGHFELNKKVIAPTPEIWHGVITPPSKNPATGRQELADYFYKNARYSISDPEYAQFSQRLFYTNLPAVEQKINILDYRNYEHFITYLEEIAFGRYNKHLLSDLIQKVSGELGSETPLMSDEAIAVLSDSAAEFTFSQYVSPFAKSLKTYLGKLNELIETTGHWQTNQYDSPETLISIRDEYMKSVLLGKTVELENKVTEAAQTVASPITLPTDVVIKAKICAGESPCAKGLDEGDFTLKSYFAGQRVADVTSAEMCGFQRGQAAPKNSEITENNSVLVEANRMYNPATTIIPKNKDDTTPLKKRAEYKLYAGCVGNNSITLSQSGVDLNPNYCKPKQALLPLYDILGSHEVTAPSEEQMSRCDPSLISFHATNDPDHLLDVYSEKAVKINYNGVQLNLNLGQFMSELYWRIPGADFSQGDNPDLVQISSAVIAAALKGDRVIGAPVTIGNQSFYLELRVNETTKVIPSVERHIEPTDETIKSIKGAFLTANTYSIPADGIRTIEFSRGGKKWVFDYFDLFRVPGSSPEEVSANLKKQITEKDAELNTALGYKADVVTKFFIANINVIEPIIWRNLGIDQKYALIQSKYIDRDSDLPTPLPSFGQLPLPPVTKPVGYEVWNLFAQGDVSGFQFGINGALLDQTDFAKKEKAEMEQVSTADTIAGGLSSEAEKSDKDSKKDHLCGDPSGVEIWEWLDAIQCWIEKEILPAEKLFTLDNSCGSGDLPAPAPEANEADIDPLDTRYSKPTQVNLTVSQHTLLAGETVEVKIKPLNTYGKEIIGYLPDPVKFTLDNPKMGEFSENDFHLFTGEGRTKLTAKTAGNTKLRVAIGDAQSVPIDLRVVDTIKIKLISEYAQEEGKSFYRIKILLVDGNGQRIDNVDTYVRLSTLEPLAGAFNSNGIIHIIQGGGEAIFFPSPAKSSVKLIANHPHYTGEILTITPPPNPPHHIRFEAPRSFEVGTKTVIPVEVVDINNVLSSGFTGPVSFRLSEQTQVFATLSAGTVIIQNGKGEIVLNLQNQTGKVHIFASHPKLKTSSLERPIFVRVDSEDWKKTYPQTLFASMVGFPAGNFLEESYFAGTHLFGGKTEAVFGLMDAPTPPDLFRVSPQYKIELSSSDETVKAIPLGSALGLYVVNQKNLNTLMSTTVPLQFSDVLSGKPLSEKTLGTSQEVLYVDITHPDFHLTPLGDGFGVYDSHNNPVLELTKNKIGIVDFNYDLVYNAESDFSGVDLLLRNGLTTIGHLFLQFAPRTLNPADLNIHPDFSTRILYSGASTKDATGIAIYDPLGEIPEDTLGNSFGFTGKNKHLIHFASGMSAGESTRFNLPPNAVLLGDPTIHLSNSPQGTLDYDNTAGHKIFQDPEGGTVIAITHFDFNNDNYEDIAAVMQDGRVRLLEGGPTDPPLRDRGDIAFMGDGAMAIESFDLANDGYDDLVIATAEGRLAILNNDHEIITRTDHNLKVGKKLYKLMKGDMDNDGYPDLVTLDSLGDIRIFYNGKNQLAENGLLIGNYGFSLSDKNLKGDIQIRYPGLKEPITATTNPPPASPVIAPSAAQNKALGNFKYRSDPNEISPEVAKKQVDALFETAKKLQNNPEATIKSQPSQLPWPEGDQHQTYFAPVDDVNFISITKTVQNKERPGATNLDLDEFLLYTLTLTSTIDVSGVVLADTVPDTLSLDLKSVSCQSDGCQKLVPKQNSILLFLSPLNFSMGQPLTITYEASVSQTPQASVLIQNLTDPDIKDPYLDILVSPPYNTTGLLIQHYSVAPRQYLVRSSTPKVSASLQKDMATVQAALSVADQCQDIMGKLQVILESGQTPSKELTDQMNEMCGLNAAKEKLTTPESCTPEESAKNVVECTEKALKKANKEISELSCIGGGCFPSLFNQPFLVPQKSSAYPIFAAPTTQLTSMGPMPVVWPVSFLGATNIYGAINSMFRIYLAPTMTGGMAIAMCGMSYMGDMSVPAPMMPLPYPPPLGNCFVQALPMGELPVCKILEDLMNQLMQLTNSIISEVGSGIAAVSGNKNVPADSETADQSTPGAGGLEVSIPINLGSQNKFNPPAKGASNTHISAFDSLGGALASWVDRQSLEIMNKLFTLPTFSILLPDVKTLFTVDWDQTEKLWEQFVNSFSAQTMGEGTGDSLSATWAADQEKGEETDVSQTLLNSTRSGQALETQAQLYTQPLEQLYAVVNSLPLVHLTEHRVDFKIPWLSAAQIQDFIRDLETWGTRMQRELDKSFETWSQFTCADEASEECKWKEAADMIKLSIEPILQSVNANIEVLESYQNFPRDLIVFKRQLADYIRGVGCYLETIANMMGGWMSTIQEQMVSYAEVIATIMEVVKQIQEMFDLFTNFNDKCDICTNERNANFGYFTLIGLVLPEIPIIKFPKWPDVVLDLSNFDGQINIDLPMINFIPDPIQLPHLPEISLPAIPSVSVLLELPKLPVLPGLPTLPELPPLPPIPTLNLPTLPPPPKLPDLGAVFEFITPFMEQLLNMWCLLKKSFAPIPEGDLSDQITLLTNRPQYLLPLDILKPKFPDIVGVDLGFNEIRIETTIYLGLRISAVWEELQKGAESWNSAVTDFSGLINKGIAEAQAALDQSASTVQDNLDLVGDTLEKGVDLIEGAASEAQKQIDSAGDKTSGKVQEQFDQAEEKMKEETTDKANTYFEEGTVSNNQTIIDAFANLNKIITTKSQDQAEKFTAFMKTEQGQKILQSFGISASMGASEAIKELEKSLDGVDLDIFLQNYLDQESEKMNQNSSSEARQQEIGKIIGTIQVAIDKINANPVDYRVVKERLGVPDIHLAPHHTVVDKIRSMRQEMIAYGDQLETDIWHLKNARDLTAFVSAPPQSASPYSLAQSTQNSPTTEVVSSSISPPKNLFSSDSSSLIAQNFAMAAEDAVDSMKQSPGGYSMACGGTCIVDTITREKVEIKSIENPQMVRMAFLPSSVSGKSHIVYSDGSGIYLKKNLNVSEPTEINKAPNVSNRIFSLDYFLVTFGAIQPAMGSMNMMKSGITRNKAGSFEWTNNTDPLAYGYGFEIQKTIHGFDVTKKGEQPVVKVILLPQDSSGKAPDVFVGDQKIEYGTLVTTHSDEDEVLQSFGVKGGSFVQKAKSIRFPTIGNATITLNDNVAVYFDQFTGPNYELKMKNGFHHIRGIWFDREGHSSSANHTELISPQIYIKASPPLDILLHQEFITPIFKSKTITASEIFKDMSGAFEFGWDINRDGLVDYKGDELQLPPQKEPSEFSIDLIASQNLEDPTFPIQVKTFKVKIYVPEIKLDETALKENKIIQGTMTPKNPDHDLFEIPFSLFRQRWGTWKNFGMIKEKMGAPTTPPLSDKNNFKQNYYAENQKGDYAISDFTSGPPTAVIVKDNTAEIAARVLPGTGQIELLKDIYHLQALPASATLPTRVSIVENSVNQILANVYYVADENTDVTILPESISQKNIKSIGVTIGDANPNDDIIAATIPGYAPTYPGGAAIFNKTLPQINVALVNSDGAIRMMQEGYTLTLKNEGKLSERPIFQIINDAGKPIFDLYIHADFTSPIIRQNETWGDLFKTIGSLVPSTNHLLASLFSVSDTSHSSLLAQSVPINKATAASPFPDVSSASPQYKAILDLYKRHVISGYGDGLFRPNSKITRAEFIKIALGVTNCFDCTMPTDAQREKYTALAPFPDVKLPAWYYFCISIAKELKMITGYGDGFFRPERNISRAEAAAVLLRQSAIEIKKASEKSFLDVPDYAWYKDYVYTAVEIGLIPNHSGFIFPDEEITRAEFAFMGSGLLNIQECTEVDSDKDGMTDPWEMLSNLDPLNDTDAASDADRDHLTALQEFRLGTNPNSPDTDGDGIPDNKDSTPHGGEKPFGKTPPVGSTSETGSEVAPDQTEGQSSGQSQGTGQPTGGEQNPGETGSIGDTGATAGACPCINNPNQNDTDGDSLIDACDTDIDADTVSNLLCIFDASGIVSLQKQKESEDNCIFTQNPDQTDSDFDHIGDVCEFEDVCPPVPEDLDGIEDIDGCPDVVDKTADNPPGVYVNKGPLCYFLDYEADLMPGDVIMNAITDVETHSVIYQQSNQVNY